MAYVKGDGVSNSSGNYKYFTLQNLDNAYAQQILALQQAAAQAAQKRW